MDLARAEGRGSEWYWNRLRVRRCHGTGSCHGILPGVPIERMSGLGRRNSVGKSKPQALALDRRADSVSDEGSFSGGQKALVTK